jgi:VWFA-related protein
MPNFPKPSRCAAILALTCSLLIFGKSKQKEEASNPVVTFTSRSELVVIPALVTGKSGAHIRGLKQEDFTVLENGVVQKIALFAEVTSDAHRWSRSGNPNEFTNSFTSGPSIGRITIILLDFINTSFVDQQSARRELLRYLAESVDRREPTAVYTLTRSGVHVIHDFTTDPRVLAGALHKVKGELFQMVDTDADVERQTGTASPDGSAGVDPGAVQTEAQKFQTMLEDRELNVQSYQQRLAIVDTLQALQQISQALVGFSGRKSLIWASGGFPFSVSDNTMQLDPIGRAVLTDVLPMYERTWQLMNEAQIALYPLDVKGLQIVTLPGAAVQNPGRNYARNMNKRNTDTQSTFQTFAAMTGGRAYFDSNDLVKGFRDAVDDSAEYYVLGYYLDRTKAKSGWRKLTVKVKSIHAEVRARSGFFVTNAPLNPGASRDADVSLALQSPLDYTSLLLSARWDKIGPGSEPGKKHIKYEMHLAADSALVDSADNNHLALEFLALAKTPDGKPAGHVVGRKIDTHLAPEKVSEIGGKGVAYSDSLDLAPGDYTVRFVVRDDLSGRIGSIAAPLKVE